MPIYICPYCHESHVPTYKCNAMHNAIRNAVANNIEASPKPSPKRHLKEEDASPKRHLKTRNAKWREKNKDAYNAYMREYMKKRSKPR